MKNNLGMYENPDRYTDPQKSKEIAFSPEARSLVRKAAEESCVLLKNNGILPLKEEAKIALIGPFADEHEIIGAWKAKGRCEESVTVKEGVENLLGRQVECARGCSWKLFEDDESEMESAMRISEQADCIVACVGEHMMYSGEAHSRADIRIPETQRKLLDKLHMLGKQLVLVVFGGRPLVLGGIEELASFRMAAGNRGRKRDCESALRQGKSLR